MSTVALNNLWTYIRGLSLSYSDRQWLAKHLVKPEEIERTKERKRDEEWVREFQTLPRGNDMTADEMKKLIRESRTSGQRKINFLLC